MEKSPEAFRTISEVADLLETPAHVLRFWESRFPQIRPVKRAGGRRYYRPGDVALLSGIKKLLHDDGMTIRGVQKILREHGVRHVAGLSTMEAAPPAIEDIEGALAEEFGPAADEVAPVVPPVSVQTAQIISLERALARGDAQVEATDTALSDADRDGAGDGDVDGDGDGDVPEAPFVEAEPAEDADGPPEGNVARLPEAEGTEGPARADSALPDEDATLPLEDHVSLHAALLRRLPPGALAQRRDEIRALHDRMLDLRDRLSAASRRRVR